MTLQESQYKYRSSRPQVDQILELIREIFGFVLIPITLCDEICRIVCPWFTMTRQAEHFNLGLIVFELHSMIPIEETG